MNVWVLRVFVGHDHWDAIERVLVFSTRERALKYARKRYGREQNGTGYAWEMQEQEVDSEKQDE